MSVELTYLNNGKWVVEESFTVNEFTIPQGFETDLASTPRILWSIFPPFGKYLRGAVVHDYLYTYRTVDRKTADKTFFIIMKKDGVHFLVAHTFYFAVRIFGFLKY
jgi:hypothetical protein